MGGCRVGWRACAGGVREGGGRGREWVGAVRARMGCGAGGKVREGGDSARVAPDE